VSEPRACCRPRRLGVEELVIDDYLQGVIARQTGAPDVDEDEGKWRLRLAGVAVALCLVAAAVLVTAALDPGLMVALLPERAIGPTSWGRTLQVVGALIVIAPMLAAVLAGVRRRGRRAGWFVVIAVLMLFPAVALIDRGAAKVRQAHRDDAPAIEQCVQRSGSENKCPGG
jgi:hypothetical protein